MKSILMSIKPKYCELIANGSKTIEVRKTRPKIDEPFKCYIYCCKQSYQWFARQIDISNHPDLTATYLNRYIGKVIGEFVCDKVDTIEVSSEAHNKYSKKACLSTDDFINYCNGEVLYGYHISDLKIYDKPKELGEFTTTKLKFLYKTDEPAKYYNRITKRVTRPPQSWCYVEAEE